MQGNFRHGAGGGTQLLGARHEVSDGDKQKGREQQRAQQGDRSGIIPQAITRQQGEDINPEDCRCKNKDAADPGGSDEDRNQIGAAGGMAIECRCHGCRVAGCVVGGRRWRGQAAAGMS